MVRLETQTTIRRIWLVSLPNPSAAEERREIGGIGNALSVPGAQTPNASGGRLRGRYLQFRTLYRRH